MASFNSTRTSCGLHSAPSAPSRKLGLPLLSRAADRNSQRSPISVAEKSIDHGERFRAACDDDEPL